jgi:hypothetical protein
MRRRSVLLLLLCVGLLTGCSNPWFPYPAPEPYVDPYPYSFTDASKPLYPLGLYGAQRFLSDVRARWTGQNNVGVQDPVDSFLWMSGDCDDFAVMVAFYLQEYFGYDTFIAALEAIAPGYENHACAFVAASSGVVENYELSCPGAATIIMASTGAIYYPVDWAVCPAWTWATHGWFQDFGPYAIEWYDLAGNPTAGAH